MKAPISFDRAADFYDQTRGFPPGIAGEVAASAAMRLRPDDRLLEIGVGTGRIARPLQARGYHLTGVDVSREMMARLRAQLPPESPRPDLLQGDATRLALADACFEVVISVHIFHLIPAWPQALSEVRRVLAPGGALLQGYNHRSERTPAARLRDQWAQITAEYGAQGVHAGLRDFAELQAALDEMGASQEQWTAAEWSSGRTINEQIAMLEQRIWSSTWEVPEAIFSECVARLRAWAVKQFGDLDRPLSTPQRFIWELYRFAD